MPRWILALAATAALTACQPPADTTSPQSAEATLDQDLDGDDTVSEFGTEVPVD